MKITKEMMGLDQEHLDLYRGIFIVNNEKYRIKRIGKHGWIHKSGRINDEMVIGHFSYQIQLSVFANNRTQFFCIDLDIEKDIQECYQKVIKVLGEPSFVVQSSTEKTVPEKCIVSGGFHLWYFSNELYPTDTLISGIKNYLRFKGVDVKSGYVEVKPDPRNSIRMPFHTLAMIGESEIAYPCGNHLLNIINPKQYLHYDNGKHFSFKESIEIVSNAPRKNFQIFLTYADPPTPTPQSYSPSPIYTYEPNRPVTPVESHTRNDTWLEWVQQFAINGNTEDEIFNIICNMMNSGTYNKGSNDWENRRDYCHKHLRDMITAHFRVRDVKWYPRPERNNNKPPFLSGLPLSDDEVEFIFSITWETVRKRYHYRNQCALFQFLKILKEKLSRDLETVPIAIEIFTHCLNNKSDRHSGDFKNFCIEHNIITLTSKHNYQNHEADEFLINKSLFNLTSCIHSDFHKAIKSYFKDDIRAIKKNYSPTYSKKILL